MQIQPITEEAHNTALLTLMAGRQELLIYRAQVQEMQRNIQGLQKEISEHTKENEDLQRCVKRIQELEIELAELRAEQE